MTTHLMFDGRLQLYRRGTGKTWQCAARVGGERFRETTREEDLARARDVAEEWYLGLRGQLRNGEIVRREKTFGEAAEHHIRQARVLAASVRSPKYIEGMELRARAHILPFFKNVPLSKVNRGMVQTYRVKRAEETIAASLARAIAQADKKAEKAMGALEAAAKAVGATITPEARARIKADAAAEKLAARGKPPARSTMDHELVFIRQVLKDAEGMGWLDHVPNLDMPYKTKTKRERRAWFSPEEYDRLCKILRDRIEKNDGRRGWGDRYEDLRDWVVLLANTGLRPDEALRLEFRDVAIEKDYATRKTILVIDVRGKTGTGYCVSMPGAVHPFERLRARRIEQVKNPKPVILRRSRSGKLERRGLIPITPEPRDLLPTDRLFPKFWRDAFNAILRESDLKYDRDGRVRTAYSLRHTYISMRLMEGANIHQIANNCRTSVQMIEQFYAAHIKDRLDTRSINIQRPRAQREASRSSRKRKAETPDQAPSSSPI